MPILSTNFLLKVLASPYKAENKEIGKHIISLSQNSLLASPFTSILKDNTTHKINNRRMKSKCRRVNAEISIQSIVDILIVKFKHEAPFITFFLMHVVEKVVSIDIS